MKKKKWCSLVFDWLYYRLQQFLVIATETTEITIKRQLKCEFTALASNNTILTYNAQNLMTATSTTAIVGLPPAKHC
jgi:hypothetical protein